MTTPVIWPAPPRPTEGVLAIARALPDGWQRGIQFQSNGCIDPVAPIYGCEQTPKPGVRPGDEATFAPFVDVLAVECSALSAGGIEQASLDGLAAVREWTVGQVLWSGGGGAFTESPNLLGVDTPGGTWDTATGAIAAAEQRWAVGANGRVGVLHLPPAVATYAIAEGAITRDNGRWRSPTGHAVSISTGYTDTVTIGAGTITGPVIISHAVHHGFESMGKPLFDVERTQNTVTARAEELHLVAFDPCLVVSEIVTIP